MTLWHLLLKVKMAKNHHLPILPCNYQMTSKVGSWGQISGSWTSHQEISSTRTLGSVVTNLFPCAPYPTDRRNSLLNPRVCPLTQHLQLYGYNTDTFYYGWLHDKTVILDKLGEVGGILLNKRQGWIRILERKGVDLQRAPTYDFAKCSKRLQAFEVRMHSSRMRTVRCCVCPGGGCGACPWGKCLHSCTGEVFARGGCLSSCTMGVSVRPPPPVNRMTDACENITFLQLL